MKLKNIMFTFLLCVLSTLDLSAAEYSDEASKNLLRCAKNGNIDGMQRALNEENANINIQNKDGNTALHLATITKKGCHQIVSQLLEYEADPNIQNNDGNSPLHFSAQNGQLVSLYLLIDNKADLNIQNKDEKTPFDLALEGIDNKACIDILESSMVSKVNIKPAKK